MADKALIKLLYKKGHGFTNIASIVGLSRQRVHQIVKDYKNTGRKNRELQYEGKEKCAICYKPAVALHHKNGRNNNEYPKNLMPVCSKCHGKLHSGKSYNTQTYSRKLTKTDILTPQRSSSIMSIMKELKCSKCGHTWYPQRGRLPKVCPRCKSYKWKGK